MSKIYLAYAAPDRAIAARIIALLREHGLAVSSIEDVPPGADFAAWISDAIRDSSKVLVLWSPTSVDSVSLRSEAARAIATGKLIPVTFGVTVPAQFSRVRALDLSAWSGEADDPRFDSLLRTLRHDMPVGAAPAQEPSAKRAAPEIGPLDSTLGGNAPSPVRRPPVPAPQPSHPPIASPYQRETVEPPAAAPQAGSRPSGGLLGRAVDRFRDLLKGRNSKPASPIPPGVVLQTRPSPPEPVLLGASAPRQCVRGQRFTAALVAYVEAARQSAKEKLSALGEPGDRVVMDVAPRLDARWSFGAPVTVRANADGVDLSPPEISFQWNGCENLAAFAAHVRDDAPDTISLAFEVFVAGVPVAFIPMNVTIATRPAPLVAQEAQASLPTSVFASYSSKDAQPVTQRLSTLLRWSPGLDIFQDCLDLQPNKSFQPQIKAEISRRDVFLLFWSRNAAASQWVQWEYQTARDTRGPDAILPMPLEDPAIAPPPADLADRHFRDRFMLAGYGLARIRDEANRPPT